jgi:hypothetical protein
MLSKAATASFDAPDFVGIAQDGCRGRVEAWHAKLKHKISLLIRR